MSANEKIAAYIRMMQDAAAQNISLNEFSCNYAEIFSQDANEYASNVFEILNGIALDCDEYVQSSSDQFDLMKENAPNFVIGDDDFLERIRSAVHSLVETHANTK